MIEDEIGGRGGRDRHRYLESIIPRDGNNEITKYN